MLNIALTTNIAFGTYFSYRRHVFKYQISIHVCVSTLVIIYLGNDLWTVCLVEIRRYIGQYYESGFIVN